MGNDDLCPHLWFNDPQSEAYPSQNSTPCFNIKLPFTQTPQLQSALWGYDTCCLSTNTYFLEKWIVAYWKNRLSISFLFFLMGFIVKTPWISSPQFSIFTFIFTNLQNICQHVAWHFNIYNCKIVLLLLLCFFWSGKPWVHHTFPTEAAIQCTVN